MKISIILFLVGSILLINTGCKKTEEEILPRQNVPAIATTPSSTDTAALPPPSPPTTITLNVSAGSDHLVFLPTDDCSLYGSVSGYATYTALWSKISGPSSFFIETPNSLGTKVSNLEKGIYQFELTISANGLSHKDTCSVIVGELSNSNEIIFENQTWGYEGLYATILWGTIIKTPNVYNYLPTGTIFKPYIKRDNSTAWEELILNNENSRYSVFLENGNLYIWSSYDETDTPDIKLVY